jgi:hypothetical protein
MKPVEKKKKSEREKGKIKPSAEENTEENNNRSFPTRTPK